MDNKINQFYEINEHINIIYNKAQRKAAEGQTLSCCIFLHIMSLPEKLDEFDDCVRNVNIMW